MTGASAVCVHDYLASGQTSICGRSAEYEAAGRVNKVLGVIVQQVRRDHAVGQRDQILFDGRLQNVRTVLRAHQNGVHALGRVVGVVLHRYLGFTVRAEVGKVVRLALGGHLSGDAVRQRDRQRHELLGFPRRVSDHHPLVAGADLACACFAAHFQCRVHAALDVRRLLFDRHHHTGGFGIEPVVG